MDDLLPAVSGLRSEILSFLSPQEILKASEINQSWRTVAGDWNQVWIKSIKSRLNDEEVSTVEMINELAPMTLETPSICWNVWKSIQNATEDTIDLLRGAPGDQKTVFEYNNAEWIRRFWLVFGTVNHEDDINSLCRERLPLALVILHSPRISRCMRNWTDMKVPISSFVTCFALRFARVAQVSLADWFLPFIAFYEQSDIPFEPLFYAPLSLLSSVENSVFKPDRHTLLQAINLLASTFEKWSRVQIALENQYSSIGFLKSFKPENEEGEVDEITELFRNVSDDGTRLDHIYAKKRLRDVAQNFVDVRKMKDEMMDVFPADHAIWK